PFVYINLLASLGFGALLGVVVDSRLKSHKCRNVFITGLAAFVVVLAAYYASWAVWLHAVTQIPIVALLDHPIGLWKVILAVNEVGTWSLRSDVINGVFLWIVWVSEAACIIGLAVYVAVQSIRDSTYCESCDRFATPAKGVCFVGADPASRIEDKAALKSYRQGLKLQATELTQHLELKDFAYVEKLGSERTQEMAWYSFDLASCPQCNITNTLSVTQFQRTLEAKKGKEKTTNRKVLHQLLLTSTEADSIRKLKEKLSPVAQAAVERGAES
ncbi:MAG TPA: hypothetical protein VG759_20355, partial [Candidatus Angelobacter sp.]|nr:hypothetical protein [Candidatus Angelobacter sp.]